MKICYVQIILYKIGLMPALELVFIAPLSCHQKDTSNVFGASLTWDAMESTCVHLDTAFGWCRRNELSFSVTIERKLDPRASFYYGKQLCGSQS
jgi:hypothetical protein